MEEKDKAVATEKDMHPRPVYQNNEPGHGRLKGKVALITGGDSGIGRAVALAYAKEGADVAIGYLDEHEDAKETEKAIKGFGQEALLLPYDISKEENCKKIVAETIGKFGRIDILVNNAAVEYEQKSIEDISSEQWEHVFRVNIFSQFHLIKFAMPHFKKGSCIINTSSVTAYKGNEGLIDYSATKGAVIAFTRSLALSLAEKGIRVNAVAPGPVWTPMVKALSEEDAKEFGQNVPLGRPAQPVEIVACYVFLASKDGSYFTGQVMHPNGGTIVNA
jgi:NAD(P)-dependent dehydrogenase (short-subunit alcohol dehydrogenase family)